MSSVLSMTSSDADKKVSDLGLYVKLMTRNVRILYFFMLLSVACSFFLKTGIIASRSALLGRTERRDTIKIRTVSGVPVIRTERAPVSLPSSTTEQIDVKKDIMKQGKPISRKDIVSPGALKITGGIVKGVKLASPDVYLRPMMAKVREALFSSLISLGAFERGSTRVLDVFAGSGSVGIEALSRGASHVTFVDMSPECTRTALRNAAACGFTSQASAVTASALSVLQRPADYRLHDAYDIVALTPPYLEVSYPELLRAACESPLVRENTLLVVEYPAEMGAQPYILGGDKFFGVRSRRYGRTILAVYVYRPTERLDLRPNEFV